MSNTSPLSHQEMVRKELQRRSDTVVRFCDQILGRPQAEDGNVAGPASADRMYRLTSFLVKYILSQPVLSQEFRRLVNLDTSAFRSDLGKQLCKSSEKALLNIVQHMKNCLRGPAENLPPDVDRPHKWLALSEEKPVGVLLDDEANCLRAGDFSDDPDIRFGQQYKVISGRLTQARSSLQLGDDVELDSLWASYGESIQKLRHLIGYEVDYAGGLAAQLLCRIHFGLCPDETAG